MTDLDPSSIIEDAGPVAPRDSPAQGKSCWHALDVADALVRLGSDRGGLTSREATRRLKSSQGFAGMPVLMITGHSDKDVVLRSIQAGAAGFLVKPIDKDKLLAKVASCLDAAMAPAVRTATTSCAR